LNPTEIDTLDGCALCCLEKIIAPLFKGGNAG
jgi:hypothetical protein